MRLLPTLLTVLACTPPPQEAPPPPPEPPLPPIACGFTLEPDPPPQGELFSVLVQIERAGAPLADAEVTVDATMPSHGHGMLTAPRTAPVGDGVYRAEGMKLHMAGSWELVARVRDAHGEEICRSPWEQPARPPP